MDCNFKEVEQIKCLMFLGRDLQRNKNSCYTPVALFVYLRLIVSLFNSWRGWGKDPNLQFQPYSKSYTLSFLRFFVTVHFVLQVINPIHSNRIIVSSGDKTQQVIANLDKPSDTCNFTNCEAHATSDILDRITLVDLHGWSNRPVFYFL